MRIASQPGANESEISSLKRCRCDAGSYAGQVNPAPGQGGIVTPFRDQY